MLRSRVKWYTISVLSLTEGLFLGSMLVFCLKSCLCNSAQRSEDCIMHCWVICFCNSEDVWWPDDSHCCAETSCLFRAHSVLRIKKKKKNAPKSEFHAEQCNICLLHFWLKQTAASWACSWISAPLVSGSMQQRCRCICELLSYFITTHAAGRRAVLPAFSL